MMNATVCQFEHEATQTEKLEEVESRDGDDHGVHLSQSLEMVKKITRLSYADIL